MYIGIYVYRYVCHMYICTCAFVYANAYARAYAYVYVYIKVYVDWYIVNTGAERGRKS